MIYRSFTLSIATEMASLNFKFGQSVTFETFYISIDHVRVLLTPSMAAQNRFRALLSLANSEEEKLFFLRLPPLFDLVCSHGTECTAKQAAHRSRKAGGAGRFLAAAETEEWQHSQVFQDADAALMKFAVARKKCPVVGKKLSVPILASSVHSAAGQFQQTL